MTRKLNVFADRMLSVVTPKREAAADTCGSNYAWCTPSGASYCCCRMCRDSRTGSYYCKMDCF